MRRSPCSWRSEESDDSSERNLPQDIPWHEADHQAIPMVVDHMERYVRAGPRAFDLRPFPRVQRAMGQTSIVLDEGVRSPEPSTSLKSHLAPGGARSVGSALTPSCLLSCPRVPFLPESRPLFGVQTAPRSVTLTMRHLLTPFTLLALVAPHPSQGQESVDLGPGSRVRITAPGCGLEMAEGTVLEVSESTLKAELEQKLVNCPVKEIGQLEIGVSRRRGLEGTLIGIGIGAGVAAFGVSRLSHTVEGDIDRPPIVGATMWILGSISIGAIAGNQIGRRIVSDHWATLPQPLRQLSFILSVKGPAGLAVSIPSLW